MTEFVDVVIVGAGISGISAAWHLQDRCPDKSYMILERRENLGGTWDLFKYPGMRSDSDMYTLGFRFKPWTSEQAIAEGPSILNYLKEAAAENGIDKHMRFGQNVVAADWSDADNRWHLTIESGGQRQEISCSFLFGCTGYYNYDEGYSPEFPGREDFEGTIVHPQHWSEDLDYQGKKIVVIGSGATAITLIPALIRSGCGPRDHAAALANIHRRDARHGPLRRESQQAAAGEGRLWGDSLEGDSAAAHCSTRLPGSFRTPCARRCSARWRERRLPEGYDVRRSTSARTTTRGISACVSRRTATSSRTIRKGRADVVTDTIERFTKTGIKLTSGRGVGRRHHRHGNGFEHAAARRPRADQATARQSTCRR